MKARPALLDSAHLAVLLLLLTRWRYWSAHVHPSVWILGLLLSRFQDLDVKVRLNQRTYREASIIPGRNIIGSHPHSSSHLRYRILRSN